MRLNFFSDVKNGHLQGNVRKLIEVGLPNFEGQRVEITIEKMKSSRSVQQNRYYFGVCVKILSKELGYSTDEIHDLIKFKFLKRTVIIGDKEETIIKSSTALTKSEFMEYIANIQQWSAELGIIIPDPNTQVDLTLE